MKKAEKEKREKTAEPPFGILCGRMIGDLADQKKNWAVTNAV